MSSTTQILFNSPALHSLKREQLIKLCKIHSLKATGKNVDLIEKLKQHALTLPRDSPLSIAARSEDASLPPHTSELLFSERARPSEQWEVVMESIEEADETLASQVTLTSQRTVGQDKASDEFGTGGSKSSVGSSLIALATSLGLKRPGIASSKPTSTSVRSHFSTADAASEAREPDELTRSAVPYSRLPPPTSVPQPDLFATEDGSTADVDMEEPVPGGVLRPGVPAPLNARLSMGLTALQTPLKQSQPTTTIRLVRNLENASPSTPQLAPFKTSFDLIMSPRITAGVGFGTFSSATTWSSGNTSIYPALPTDISGPATYVLSPVRMATNVVGDPDGDVTMPGAFSPSNLPGSPPTNVAANAKVAPLSKISSGDDDLRPPDEPFIFGSPLPKHRVSDAQFRAAAVGVLDEMNKRLQVEGVGVVDTDIIKRLHPCSHAGGNQTVEDSGINEYQESEIKGKFNKKHQAEFQKMEGIDAYVQRKAAKTSGLSKEGNDDKVAAGKKRKSSVLIDEPRRVPSQLAGHVSGTRVISNGRRSKMIPGGFDEDFDDEIDVNDGRGQKRAKMENGGVDIRDTESQTQKEKEREAIRRKLEANKARRRSSAAARQSGRVSLGRVQQKHKSSRFGFLAQAKSIVQSVFGRSKPVASTLMAPTVSSKAKVGRQDPEQTKLPATSSSKNPANATRPTDSITRSMSNKTSLESRASTTLDKEQRSYSSARSRSPIPPFTGSSTSFAGLVHAKRPGANIAPTHSRSNSGSSSDISSTGSKPSAKIPSTSTHMSFANGSVAAGSFGIKKSSDRGQQSLSRLHAPTASSLAKTGGHTSVGANLSLRNNKQTVGTSVVKKETTLSSITNNVAYEAMAAPGPTSPPPPGKIFSKPLNPTILGNARKTESERCGSVSALKETSKQPLQRQRTLSGRKPRISRSKVISRLASQRAGVTKSEPVALCRSGATGNATGKTLAIPRTRSSLSAKVKNPVGRSSHTGVGISNGANDLLMSAKKRARQSEYYTRRKSRVETGAIKQPST